MHKTNSSSLSGLNSGGTNKKSVGANNSSRKSDTSAAGCGAYNAEYQSDDSILEDRADNSVTKVGMEILCLRLFINVLKVWGWKSEKEQVGGESPGAGGAASGEGGHKES